jgi:hypothetical protein
MRSRVASEIALLKAAYPRIQHQEAGGEDWFLIPSYGYPAGWNRRSSPVCFRALAGYPAATPYGFWVPRGARFKHEAPNNYDETASEPPFPLTQGWGRFSWAPDSGWSPLDDPTRGSNLLQWARSFRRRLEEGR